MNSIRFVVKKLLLLRNVIDFERKSALRLRREFDETNANSGVIRFRTGNGCTAADFRSGFTNQRTKEPFHSSETGFEQTLFFSLRRNINY